MHCFWQRCFPCVATQNECMVNNIRFMQECKFSMPTFMSDESYLSIISSKLDHQFHIMSWLLLTDVNVRF